MTFEHEGHIYLVRRTISGANSTVRAEAQCDGLAMAEGARDTGRYVHSVLGMDDGAFRASVFAEQKQLAAFSSQSPAERRKLVLALLGVTPLDAARDKARADARQTTEQHKRLRGMLPDLDEAKVSADDAEARAGAADTTASEEEKAAAAAGETAVSSKASFTALDRLRQEHELLVMEGKAARSELETANKLVAELEAELADLAGAEANLEKLKPEAAGLEAAEQQAQLLRSLLDTAKELASQPEGVSPPLPDDAALTAAEGAAMAARAELGSAEARGQAAASELQRAQEARSKSTSLSGTEDCPLCGQHLGEAFESVQAHRQEEVKAAEAQLTICQRALTQAADAAATALAVLQRVGDEVRAARHVLAAYEQARAAREAGSRRVATSIDALAAIDPALTRATRPQPEGKEGGGRPGPGESQAFSVEARCSRGQPAPRPPRATASSRAGPLQRSIPLSHSRVCGGKPARQGQVARFRRRGAGQGANGGIGGGEGSQ